MRITVRLFAQYREGFFKEEVREFPLETTVQEVIENLGIRVDLYPIGIMVLNGRHASLETILHEGDVLGLFPKVGGG